MSQSSVKSSRRNSASFKCGSKPIPKKSSPKSQPLFCTVVPSAGLRLAGLEVTAL